VYPAQSEKIAHLPLRTTSDPMNRIGTTGACGTGI